MDLTIFQSETYKKDVDSKQIQRDVKIAYDMKSGEALIFWDRVSNALYTTKHSVWTFFPYTMWNFLTKEANLFYLIISLIMSFWQNINPFLSWIYWIPFGFSLMTFLIKEIIFDLFRMKNDFIRNKRKTMVCIPETGELAEKKWKDLQLGNIIYLVKGDTAPCDMILLDSNEISNKEAICYVEDDVVSGRSQISIKKACSVTQIIKRDRRKNNFKEYKKMLSGSVEYEYPTKNINSFNGLIKLKKDPKKGVLTIENLILRGSKIRTGWVFGLAAYTGSEMKGAKLSNLLNTGKISNLERSTHFPFIILILLVIMMSCISLIISYAKNQNIGVEEDNNSWFTHLIVYTTMVPITFYSFFDLCAIIEKFRLERSEKEPSTKLKYSTIINNADILTDLAHINYVFLDKTGTLTSENVELCKIFVNGKIYQFEENYLKNNKNRVALSKKATMIVQEQEPNLLNIEEQLGFRNIPSFQNLLPSNKLKHQSSAGQDDENANFLNLNINKNPTDMGTEVALPSKRNIIFSNIIESGEGFLKDLESEDALKELIRSFAFCHNSKVIYQGVENSYFESSRKEEEILLDFARANGFSLEKVTKSEMKGEYIIRDTENKTNYNILGTNEFSYSRGRFSLLMDEGPEKGCTLYCKGNLHSMQNQLLLEEEDREYLNQISNSFKEQGVKMSIYASRKFNKEETKELINRLKNLKFSLMTQEEELEELANEMEVKLDLVGIVGYREQMRKEVPEMIRFFQDINIGIWVVSGDTYDNVMNCAINGNIINSKKNEGFFIQAENIEDISVSIKNILTEIRIILDPFQQNQNFNNENDPTKNQGLKLNRALSVRKVGSFNNKYVVINGKSLDLIMKNVYLRDHFIFITSFVKVLIGYNLSPQNKESLVQSVRNNFFDQPNVLAIGDGFNDSLMMQSANVGIELMHKNKSKSYEIIHNYGDILISNLSQIKPLMIYKGKRLYEKMEHLLGIIIYQNMLLGMTFFAYNWSYNFENHQLYESYFVLFFGNIFYFLQMLTFALFNESFKVEILKFFPALYVDGTIRIKRKIPKPFLKYSLEAFLTSIMIIYVTSAILENSIDCNGKEIDFEGVQWVFIFSLFFIMAFKYLYNFKTKSTTIWMLMFASFLAAFGILISLVYLYTTSGLKKYSNYDLLVDYLHNNSNMWFAFLFNVFTSSSIGYFKDAYLDSYLFPSIFDYFAVKNKGIMWSKDLIKKNGKSTEDLIDNKTILMKSHKEISLGQHINHIFKDIEVMDNLVYEMINPFDINLINLKVQRFSLRILDYKLKTKYFSFRIPFLLSFYKRVHWFLTLIFGIYSLISGLLFQSNNSYSNLAIFLFFVVYGLFFFSRTYRIFYYQSVYLSSIFLLGSLLYYQWSSLKISIIYTTCLSALVFTINFNLNLFYLLGLNLVYHLLMYIRIGIFFDDIETFSDFRSSFEMKFYIIFVEILLTLSLQFLNFLILYEDEKLRRNEFLAAESLTFEQNTKRDILSILVPKFVKNYLDQGKYSIQQNQDDVVILFCDICDFDKLIATKGRKIVEMLDKLFRKFDHICIAHGLQKIETVGKTYMACAGIKASETEFSQHILQTEKTKRVINASFDMMHDAEANDLKLKIGINRGRIIAGVIGYHKPQFSLIGDTVNTTSRLCSTGEDGQITISQTAFQAVKFTEFFFYIREVVAKGLGKIPTYQVSKVSRNTLFKTKINKAMLLIKNKKLKEQIKEANEQEDQNKVPSNSIQKKSSTDSMDKNEKAKDLLQRYFQKKEPQRGSVNLNISNSKVEKGDIAENEPKQADVEEDSDEEEAPEKFLESKTILFSLFFTKNERIVEFYQDLEKNTNFNFRITLLLYSLVYFVHALILIRIKDDFDNYDTIVGLRIVSASLIVAFQLFKKNLYSNNFLKLALFIVMLFSFWISFYQGIAYSSNLAFLQTFQLIEMSLTFTVVLYFPLFPILFSVIFYFLQVLAFFLLFSYGYGFSTDNIFYFFMYTTIHLVKIYHNKKSVIDRFNNTHIRAKKRIEQEGLVSQLLPSHAFEKLKSTTNLSKYELTDQFDDVTLLFADIAGFTKFSSSVNPEEVVSMLRTLFTEFDKSCLKYKVYKVYTIGDCYVVMSFTNSFKRNPVAEAKNVVRMGLSMIEIIKQVKQVIGFKDMNMRIGIHTGSIIGGIIGTDIVRYDIYGKDVVVANKMESNGVEGNIMISEATKIMLEKDKEQGFNFEFLKSVEIKGSDKLINAYLILNKEETEIQ